MALNREQLARLNDELDANYRRSVEDVRSELEARGDHQYAELLNRDPADAGDASVADLLASLSFAEIERHLAEVRDIEAARLRIRDGSYGFCAHCGSEISFERLLAYPTAKRCLPCQQVHERTYAGQETPTL